MIDRDNLLMQAQILALRNLLLKTMTKAYLDMPERQFASMLDAWVAQLATDTYPHLGAELSDALAAEIQEMAEEMAQSAKIYRTELERIAREGIGGD